MAAVGLTVEYAVGWDAASPDALEQLAMGFERAGIEVSKWGTYLFPRLMPVFEQAVARQFSEEGGGPSQGKWPELSDAYAARKARRWPGRPILVASGALVAALTNSHSAGALRETTPTTLAYGTRGIEYASYHQTGTPRMPSRPPVDFDDDAADAIEEAAKAALRDLVAVARLDQLLEETPAGAMEGPEQESVFGPMTQGAASFAKRKTNAARAAKAKTTRIGKLAALRKSREGK